MPLVAPPPLSGSLLACELMAETLNKEFGTAITPDQVRDIFAKHWERLSTLAHAIHKGGGAMSEMVERLAREIERKSNYVISEHHSKALARNVLEAMREPPDTMVDAGLAGAFGEMNWQVATAKVWSAMIEEALK